MQHFISVCGLSLAWVTSENSTSTGMPTSFDSIFFAGPYLVCYCPRSRPHLSVVPRQLSAVQFPSALVRVPSSTPFASPYHFRIRRDFRSKNPLSGFAPKQTKESSAQTNHIVLHCIETQKNIYVSLSIFF